MGWLLSLTDHQLNVLTTVFSVIASMATALGVLTAVYSRLGAKNSKRAAIQTEKTEWHNGHLVYVADPESRTARRHRLPTSEIDIQERQ